MIGQGASERADRIEKDRTTKDMPTLPGFRAGCAVQPGSATKISSKTDRNQQQLRWKITPDGTGSSDMTEPERGVSSTTCANVVGSEAWHERKPSVAGALSCA